MGDGSSEIVSGHLLSSIFHLLSSIFYLLSSMLTQLTTIKARLQILDTDNTYDALLTNAIKAVSARFDKETARSLARTENATFEFPADVREICPPGYPIETVTKFETKSTEAEGWQEKTGINYL